jgi:hypothetical protein
VTEQSYPTRPVQPDAFGWGQDEEKKWLRGEPGKTWYTDDEGWFWTPVAVVKQWEWPVTDAEPDPNSWSYAARCPTRYSWAWGGRRDVEAWARWLIDNYSCWVNTYHHHPESVWLEKGVSREFDSFDVWGPGGRSDPIDPAIGDQIFNLLFYDPNPPNIEWIIWREVMYGAWNAWRGEYFGDGSEFMAHMDHLHGTYV